MFYDFVTPLIVQGKRHHRERITGFTTWIDKTDIGAGTGNYYYALITIHSDSGFNAPPGLTSD
jgi:hypothetical protein